MTLIQYYSGLLYYINAIIISDVITETIFVVLLFINFLWENPFSQKDNIAFHSEVYNIEPHCVIMHSFVNKQIYFLNQIYNMHADTNGEKNEFLSNIICWKGIARAQELTHLYHGLRARCRHVRNVKT